MLVADSFFLTSALVPAVSGGFVGAVIGSIFDTNDGDA